jgi:hypothetical protein
VWSGPFPGNKESGSVPCMVRPGRLSPWRSREKDSPAVSLANLLSAEVRQRSLPVVLVQQHEQAGVLVEQDFQALFHCNDDLFLLFSLEEVCEHAVELGDVANAMDQP